ncbi:MAG: zf-HC2 domain-containing protein, partial [Clostridia bacterium]|nr:zf-HC2 domain-containing protein [Clostridia bacterium]
MVRTNEDCLKIRELFSPALDQEITPEEQTQLEKHLEECSVCRKEWSDWLELSASLQDLEWDCLPPPDFSRQIMQKIHQQVPKQSKNRINRWKALGGIAAALALAAGTVTWVDHLNSVPPTVAVREPQPQVTSILDNPKLTPETPNLEVPSVVQPEIPQEAPTVTTTDKPSAESPNKQQENPNPAPSNEPGS